MIRFAILAGVSTDAQATPHKISIPDQVANCRAHISAHNGIETAGPYIMDGYTRTGYDSLEIAMREIPPLASAINAAHQDEYDILLMDNFDRLGDLGFIVKTRFKKLRKQLRSIRQSGKLIPPDQYDPYAAETDDIAMYVEGIIQTYRINKIRRGWNIGVPQRARSGLHPLTIPFGYQQTAKDQPLQPIPEQIDLIQKMVNAYLSGETLQAICTLADNSGVPPRRASRWTRQTVKQIIHNQYYAGITTFGKYKTIEGRRIPVPPSQWITGEGQHQPVYGQDTYLAILQETDRREGTRARSQTYALSGLLTCSVCQSRLHRHGKIASPYPVDLSCPNGHIHIQYDLALKIVAQNVTKELTHVTPPESSENRAERLLWSIEKQEELRRQIQTGYENKLYTTEEAHTRITAIEKEITRLKNQHTRTLQNNAQKQTLHHIAGKDLTLLKDWILHDDPTTVNRLLTALIQTITLTPQYHPLITWR